MNVDEAEIALTEADYSSIVDRAEFYGMPPREFFLQECVRAWSLAVKHHQERVRIDQDRQKAVERARYHEANELYRQQLRERPEGVGKGWNRGMKKIGGRYVRQSVSA